MSVAGFGFEGSGIGFGAGDCNFDWVMVLRLGWWLGGLIWWLGDGFGAWGTGNLVTGAG